MSERTIVKVLVGIPNQGHTEVDAYDNRMMLFQHLGALEVLSKLGIAEFDGTPWSIPDGIAFEFSLATVGNTLTPIARERIAEVALEYGFDYLFFIDDDMIAPEDLFLRLYRHQKDIVGALAFTRSSPHRPVIFVLDEGFDPVAKKHYYIPKAWLDYPKDSLVECDAVGFGSVLIKASILLEMKRPWFTAATGKGEDVQFCFDAKKCGFKVYMDTSTKLGHLGRPLLINEELFEKQQQSSEVAEDPDRKLNGKGV